MRTRYFALLYGVIFLVAGILGFIPALLSAPDGPPLVVQGGYARLFGLFPINWLHNAIHIAFGLWGVAVYRSFRGARTYFQSVAVIYGILTVMGLIPTLSTVFGLVPIFSHDIWLHAILAIVAAFIGFGRVRQTEVVTSEPGQYRDERPRRTGT